jgi:hypothetical protein
MNTKMGEMMLIVVTVAALLLSPLSVLAGSPVGISGSPPQFLPSQDSSTIEGYVTDNYGTGIYDAQVYYRGPSGDGSTFTDNVGYYSVSGLRGGYYTITASPPYGSSLVLHCTTIEVAAGETTTLNFVLSEGGMIEGRVTDNYGIGVYNAQIYASASGFGGEAYTDDQGYYSVVGVPGGTCEVWAYPPPGANILQGVTTVQVVLGENTTLDFVLPAGGVIEGQVTDNYGIGVYNAYVGAGGPGSGGAYTDNQGDYFIVGLQSGSYEVWASPPSEADLLSSSATADVVMGENTTVNFVLLPAVRGNIAGQVTNEDLVGLSGIHVSASGPEGSGYDYTDSSGNYSIDGLQIGSYTVTASPSTAVNLLPDTATGVVVAADTTTDQDFVLPVGGIIEGVVTDNYGVGVYLAYMYASGPGSRGTSTDEDGNYSIVGLPGDNYSYSVTATCSGGNLLPGTASALVHLGENTTANFVLAAGGIIAGLVTDEDETGLYFAYVSASGPRNGYDYTEPDGSYSIAGLRTGSYTVSVQPPSGPSGVNLLTVSATVQVNEGQTTTLNLTLRWGGIIDGRVTDNYGVGVYNAYVEASGPNWRYAYTDNAGNYSVVGLRSGGYSITVSPSDWDNLLPDTDTADVTQGSTTTRDFVLPWGGIVAGHVTDADGAGVYSAYISAYGAYGGGSATTDSDGYYFISGLQSDNYSVWADPTDYVGLVSSSDTAEVVEGDITTLNLVLPAGGIIAGRVTVESGAGVAYAYIEAYGQDHGGYGYAYASWDGYYSIVGLQSDNYTLTATPRYEVDLVPGSAAVEAIQGGTITANFVLNVDTTAPGQPTLLSPGSWERIDHSYTLDWTDVSDDASNPVTYDLLVFNFDWSLAVLSKSGLTSSEYNLSSETLADGTYRWIVRAVDGASNVGDWAFGEPFILASDFTAPGQPTLQSPGSWERIDHSYTLDWSDVIDEASNPVTYDLLVFNFDWSSMVVVQGGLTPSEYNLSSETLVDGTYWWIVRAVDGAGNVGEWAFGGPFILASDFTAPGQPILQSPGSWERIDHSYTLNWTEVIDDASNPVTYDLLVFNFDWSSMVVVQGGLTPSEYNLSSETLADGTYWWIVRAVDGAGNIGDWAFGGPFVLVSDTTAPGQPTLQSPGIWETIGPSYTLDWTDVIDDASNPVTYDLLVFNFDWSSMVVVQGGLTTSEYNLSSETLADGTHWWIVRAVDGAGNIGDWAFGGPFIMDNSLP